MKMRSLKRQRKSAVDEVVLHIEEASTISRNNSSFVCVCAGEGRGVCVETTRIIHINIERMRDCAQNSNKIKQQPKEKKEKKLRPENPNRIA